MAVNVSSTPLTIEQFERLYGEEKPAYEYWDGIAIQKPMPTLLHSFLQFVLQTLFIQRGLAAGGEVRVKIHPTREPVPDVIAGERLQAPYPKKPMPIVVEILSPGDSLQQVRRKCQFYAAQQIPGIYVFDPEDRTSDRWNAARKALEPVTAIEIPGQAPLLVSEIWSALDERLKLVDFDES